MSSRFRPRSRPALALLALALLAACSRPQPAPVISATPPTTAESVVLYFPHKSRPVLVREVRRAERHGEQPEFFALRLLLQGPESAEARPVFAGGAELGLGGTPDQVAIGAKVLEGDVNLLLTSAAGAALAQAQDRLAIYAIVDTLAAFPRVKSVRFLVEGQPPAPLLVDGLDLSQPLTPRWDIIST